MKKKSYVLLIKEDSDYVGFSRFIYKFFNNYLELQKHLLKFKYENNFIVYEETNIKLDKTLLPERKLY